MERYHRQTMLPQLGTEGQQKLLDASVLLVGVGGLGSPVALYLVAAGIGRIGLIDFDTVSLNNLQRQVLYTEAEIGKSKALCAEKRLRQLNSEVCVEAYDEPLTAENAETLISKYDLVIDGCDNYATRYLIDDVCACLQRPYVYGSIGAFSGQVSVFNYAGAGRYADLFPDREYLEALPKQPVGVIGSIAALIGSVEALEAIKIITGCEPPLAGKLYTLDMRTMQSQLLDI